MKYEFNYLLNLGFEQSDIKWLNTHVESLLEYLDDYGISGDSFANLKTMLELDFDSRTVLALWMCYTDSFVLVGSEVFKEKLQQLIEMSDVWQLDSWYWSKGELPVFDELREEDLQWKMALENFVKQLVCDRKQKAEKLIEIGFEREDVEELEEKYEEPMLSNIMEYYLDEQHLKNLKIVLDAGFYEILLLELFVEHPEYFGNELAPEIIRKRVEQMSEVWDCDWLLIRDLYHSNETDCIESLFKMDDEKFNFKICDEYF